MRHLRVLLTVLVGAGLCLVAPAAAHAAAPRAAGDCATYQSLSSDLGDLESSSEFDAAGYTKLAADYADAAKDAPASLAKALKTSSKFYATVGKAKSTKAAIALYRTGLKKYKTQFQALDDYLAKNCATTTTT